jgi:hypothetical protein
LRGSGFSLLAVWRGSEITSTTRPDLSSYAERTKGTGLQQRWIDVDAAACATGRVTSAVVVKEDGSPLNAAAYLELVLVNGDGLTDPFYEVTHKAPPVLPADNPPLSKSELAHLGGVLDRQFVLAASPANDGIEVNRGRSWRAEWDVPATVTALRFQYRCAKGDELEVGVQDITTGKSEKKTDSRIVECTGAAATLEFPDPPDKVTISTAVRERRTDPTGAPKDVFGPFVVEVVPIS